MCTAPPLGVVGHGQRLEPTYLIAHTARRAPPFCGSRDALPVSPVRGCRTGAQTTSKRGLSSRSSQRTRRYRHFVISCTAMACISARSLVSATNDTMIFQSRTRCVYRASVIPRDALCPSAVERFSCNLDIVSPTGVLSIMMRAAWLQRKSSQWQAVRGLAAVRVCRRHRDQAALLRVRSGSWPCENVGMLRRRRMTFSHPSRVDPRASLALLWPRPESPANTAASAAWVTPLDS
jgi:hypothetical protein